MKTIKFLLFAMVTSISMTTQAQEMTTTEHLMKYKWIPQEELSEGELEYYMIFDGVKLRDVTIYDTTAEDYDTELGAAWGDRDITECDYYVTDNTLDVFQFKEAEVGKNNSGKYIVSRAYTPMGQDIIRYEIVSLEGDHMVLKTVNSDGTYIHSIWNGVAK